MASIKSALMHEGKHEDKRIPRRIGVTLNVISFKLPKVAIIGLSKWILQTPLFPLSCHMAAEEGEEWLIDMGFTPEYALKPGYGPDLSDESFLDPDRVEEIRRATSSSSSSHQQHHQHHHQRALPKKKKAAEPILASLSPLIIEGKHTGGSASPAFQQQHQQQQQQRQSLPALSISSMSPVAGGPRSPYFPGKYTVQCQDCDKSFPCMSKLRRHEVVHTKVKPFKCDYCGKGFSQQCSVTVHITMMHHGGSASTSIEEAQGAQQTAFQCDEV